MYPAWDQSISRLFVRSNFSPAQPCSPEGPACVFVCVFIWGGQVNGGLSDEQQVADPRVEQLHQPPIKALYIKPLTDGVGRAGRAACPGGGGEAALCAVGAEAAIVRCWGVG
jgi:hypothetical protein